MRYGGGDAPRDFARQRTLGVAFARGKCVDRPALVRDLAAIARETGGERRGRRAARIVRIAMKCSGVVNRRKSASDSSRWSADRRREQRFEFRERDGRQRHAAVDHAACESARHLVRLAERNPLGADQRIGELGQRDAASSMCFRTFAASIVTAASNPARSASIRCAVSNAS